MKSSVGADNQGKNRIVHIFPRHTEFLWFEQGLGGAIKPLSPQSTPVLQATTVISDEKSTLIIKISSNNYQTLSPMSQ